MLHRAGSGRTDIRNCRTGRSRTCRTAVSPGRMETVPLTVRSGPFLLQLEMYTPEQYWALLTAICSTAESQHADGRAHRWTFRSYACWATEGRRKRVPESIAAGDATWVHHFRFVHNSLECSETPAISESQKIQTYCLEKVWHPYCGLQKELYTLNSCLGVQEWAVVWGRWRFYASGDLQHGNVTTEL